MWLKQFLISFLWFWGLKFLLLFQRLFSDQCWPYNIVLKVHFKVKTLIFNIKYSKPKLLKNFYYFYSLLTGGYKWSKSNWSKKVSKINKQSFKNIQKITTFCCNCSNSPGGFRSFATKSCNWSKITPSGLGYGSRTKGIIRQ